MLLLQYSRQAAYLQCKLSNVLSSKHCDCEKILAEDEPGDSHEGAVTTTSKVQMPDEMFLYTTGINKNFTTGTLTGKPVAFIQLFQPQSFHGELVKPPRA